MPDIVPTDDLSLPLENLRVLVANCPSWQNWTGATDGTDEENYARAYGKIHLVDVPPPEANSAEYSVDEIKAFRPCAIVDLYDRPKTYNDHAFITSLVANETFLDKGILTLHVEDNVDEQLGRDFAAAKISFTNKLGKLLNDLKRLSGTSGLLYVSKMEVTSIIRPDTTQTSGLGDYFQADILVYWGIGR